jgi:hypothetical protein
MPLSDLQLVVFHDIQRPLHSASVSEKSDFALLEISNDGDLSLDAAVSSQCLEVLE